MKRQFYFFLIFAMLTCVTACSQKNQNVPEKMLEWEVEDYLKYNSIYENDTYTSYDMQTSHSYDKETKTDTVRIKLTVNYPRYVASSSYEGTYKYNKEKEEWEIFRGGGWSPLQIERFTITDSQDDWILALKKNGFTDIDLPTEEEAESNKERIQQQYFQEEVPSGSVTDYWELTAGGNSDNYGGNSDGYSDTIMLYMAFDGEESAEAAYRALVDKVYSDPDQYYISYSAKGKNYEYMLVYGMHSYDRVLLVYNENRLYWIEFWDVSWIPYDLLHEVGFTIDYNAEWG